ncbi:MAG: S-layer homology domain-containing protein [Oscillospiraceae bacterium]|nr:S-layer homology domain-containing protein [Oscillospiraceae bacterium]
MKLLFRVFCALALTVLVTVSAAAGFTDDAQIQNRAAVAFLSDLGLVNGYPDGSFRPGLNVRRGEAAKLAAMICEEAPTPMQHAPYEDVPEAHWAAPYIDYCTEKGIVSGEGGRFRPDGFLTGRELAKILLACVGFDGRQYTGKDWAAAVDRDANRLGIYTGIATDPAAIISRDNVCRMIYNAIQCPAVVGKDAGGEPVYATDALLNPITYMEHRFRVIKFTGVVTGNEYADLTREDACLERGQTVLQGHAPFPVSTGYSALGRTAELTATRTVVGNDVFYNVLGIPAIVPTEEIFSVNGSEAYASILRYANISVNAETEYYLDGNRDSQDFLIRLEEDCVITGIDRDGNGVLDAVLAYNYHRGTVLSAEPLRVFVGDGQYPAVLCGVDSVTEGGECRCLQLGGTYYIVP